MIAWWRRLGYWLRGRRAAVELEDELQFHREMAERDLLQRGEPALDAARAARRAMGNTLLAREDARAVWVAPWLDGLWQDVRHGVRSLRRSPGLVIVSALSLGLGIGLNAMLYMGISTIFWHRPTMADPARTVGVEPGSTNQFSHPDYQDLLASRIFDDAAGFRIESLNLGSGARVVRVGVLAVTANFFRVLGVEARQGRTFSPVDAAPEREPREVVVSAEFWRTSLGADPAAVGSTLVLNGESFTVVGVLPDGYRSVVGWVGPQIYAPLSRLTLQALNERRTPSLSVIARLPSSATARQAETAVTALMTSLERAYPDRLAAMGRTASVFPAADAQFRGVQRRFQQFATLALVMAGLVLLIACVNVSGLLMARATERRREIAVRLAVGAGRARVVQAMLVESCLLVMAGAVMGLVLTFVLNQISFPASMAWVQDVTAVDTRLLPYAVMLVLATTLVCGVVPALRATRGDVAVEVRQGGETVTPRLWWRQTLVIAQVAMSLVLIVASLLCVRSQLQIARVDLGFDIEHGVVARLGLDATQYPGEARVPFADRVVERIGQIPGVSSVSLANVIPLGGDSLVRSFHPAGRTDIPGTRASTYSVGPSFFRTLGIPLLKGREFDTFHRPGAPVVAIVNETFARTYFPGRDVIGQHVQTEDEPEAEVIGLVRDHRIGTIGEAPQSVVFYPFAQRPRSLIVHARTTASPDALVTEVQRAMDDIDATIPLSVQTLRGATSLELTMRRVGTLLMGTLGAVGLLLAMIGLYGVMSYVAASRTAEVGIRMALGATRPRIRREMLQRASIMVARGVALGALASVVVTPAFSTFLAGTSPFDPIAFGGAALLMVVIGLAASYLPAVRSSRLDPMRALRRQ
jgi:predicted permease